jgi:hypothetical protein
MPAMEVDDATVRGLLESVVPTLSDYSIGFVLLEATNDWPDGSLGGSGTLVRIDESEGILTACHVIERLKKNKHVGLVLPTAGKELHHISFESSLISQLSFCPCGEPVNGPDLGVLVPPPDVLGTLRARKSFYNMSKRQQRILETPEPLQDGLWVLSGFAGEWTGDGVPEQGFKRVKYFRGMHAGIKLTRESDEGNFDYLFLEALYNESYEGPDKFGGFSGGGAWQLLVKPDGGRLRVVNTLLSGVAFYESERRNHANGQVTRDIKCHGRRSLYNALIDEVRAHPP